jgi:hypothetical protein
MADKAVRILSSCCVACSRTIGSRQFCAVCDMRSELRQFAAALEAFCTGRAAATPMPRGGARQQPARADRRQRSSFAAGLLLSFRTLWSKQCSPSARREAPEFSTARGSRNHIRSAVP